MRTKQIFIYISLILIIYKCNSFIIKDYEKAKNTIDLTYDLGMLEILKKQIAEIEITYEKKTSFVNGLVNDNSIIVARNLLENSNIIKLRYIYDSNEIIMTNIKEYPLKSDKQSKLLTILNSNETKRNNPIKYKSLFYNERYIRSTFIPTAIKLDSFQKLKHYLMTINLEVLSEYFLYYQSNSHIYYYFNHGEIKNYRWYILGKVEDNKQEEFIPLNYINSNNILVKIVTSGIKKTKVFEFIYGQGTNFTKNDVGSYIFYCNVKCNIIAQITDIKTIDENQQVLLIDIFDANLEEILITYDVIQSTSRMADPDTKIPTSKSLHSLSDQSAISNSLGEPKPKRVRLDNHKSFYKESQIVDIDIQFCNSINKVGEYHLDGNITITVMEIEDSILDALQSGVYHIEGIYTYNGRNFEFSFCHVNGHNGPYLNNYEEELEPFYLSSPNISELHNESKYLLRKVDLDNSICENINKVGKYLTSNNIIIKVTKKDEDTINATMKGYLNINGTYFYNNKTTEFTYCHRGNKYYGPFLNKQISESDDDFYLYGNILF